MSPLRCLKIGDEREMAFVQYMEVTTPFDLAKKYFGCIRVRWTTSDDTEARVCGKMSEGSGVDAAEWNGVESLS